MAFMTSGEAGQDHRLHIAKRGVEAGAVETYEVRIQRVAFGFQRDLVGIEDAGAHAQPCELQPHQRRRAVFAQPDQTRRHGRAGACTGGFSLGEQGVGLAVEGGDNDDHGLAGAHVAVGFSAGRGVVSLGGQHRAAEFQHAERAGGG